MQRRYPNVLYLKEHTSVPVKWSYLVAASHLALNATQLLISLLLDMPSV